MKITREGTLYKTAYMFQEPKDRPTGYINGYTLLWRYAACGIAWYVRIALRSVLQLLGYILVVAKAVIVLPYGYRLVWSGPEVPGWLGTPAWIPLWSQWSAEFAWPGNWQSQRIRRWPVLFGSRHWLGIALTVVAIVIFETMVINNAYEAWSAATSYEELHGNVWVIVVLNELAISVIALCFFLYYWSHNSEVAQLTKLRLQSLWDRTCPVVEIVD